MIGICIGECEGGTACLARHTDHTDFAPNTRYRTRQAIWRTVCPLGKNTPWNVLLVPCFRRCWQKIKIVGGDFSAWSAL